MRVQLFNRLRLLPFLPSLTHSFVCLSFIALWGPNFMKFQLFIRNCILNGSAAAPTGNWQLATAAASLRCMCCLYVVSLCCCFCCYSFVYAEKHKLNKRRCWWQKEEEKTKTVEKPNSSICWKFYSFELKEVVALRWWREQSGGGEETYVEWTCEE